MPKAKSFRDCVGLGRNGAFTQMGTSVWANKALGHLHVSAVTGRGTDGGCRMELTPEMARELIKQLQEELENLK